jgi:hypothetical protein
MKSRTQQWLLGAVAVNYCRQNLKEVPGEVIT